MKPLVYSLFEEAGLFTDKEMKLVQGYYKHEARTDNPIATMLAKTQVSQSSSVNLSKYKKLENQWSTAINEGKKVSVNVKVNYEGASLRPTSFEIKYAIDGAIKKTVLKN